MLLLLLNLAYSQGDTGNPKQPNLTITVEATRNPEIYMEPTKVICDSCSYTDDTSALFVAANRHHRTWFKEGSVHAIYNRQTVGLKYPECDFEKATYQCMQENGVWLLKSTITVDKEKASLNLLLISHDGRVMGQSTYVSHKKTQIVHREKEIKSLGGIPGTGYEASEKEPVVIEIRPVLGSGDIDQAMIMMYDSIR